MTEKIADRRVKRTRTMLIDALLDLMIEKGYEPITVQDIIDRANVGRSTFYSHYSDKEQLLLDSIYQLQDYLVQQKTEYPALNEWRHFKFGFSLAMLQHVQGYKRLYRVTVGKQRGAIVEHHMKQMLAKIIRDDVERLMENTNVMIPPEIAVEYIVSTFFSLLTWWMDQNNPCSAEEVDRMFHKLTFSGLSG
ncbi:TetR family transcriptional regulator [Bacillus oleivorans]|uniref:TetR family transcriptional regulator n=1 Tax=Bacillus oleivorans TaxID=1448271 RepID=A0A285CT65_9BACI|nr:TetR/AcrR family transcriptional regulator [Bacillus oleivorans]SNX70757.1 TetR family transcriptional regulator [Bacillus oleivorans]